jgi:hypothetical protein
MEDNSREDVVTGSWYWHESEIIASLLAFDAVSRQKQTITRVFGSKLAAGCYVKFAKKMQSEGKWDPKIEITKSRDVRLKYILSRENAGESPAYKKVAEVKREILKVILPIYIRLTPQGSPPSGIKWPELMTQVKTAYFEYWKKGKKKYTNKDMIDNWTTVEWAAFEYLGPQGMYVSCLKAGSLENNDGDVNTSRESARKVAKDNKKHGYAHAITPMDENDTIRAAISKEMAAHTKMANKRLILQFRTPEDKAQVIKDAMADLTNAPDVEVEDENE